MPSDLFYDEIRLTKFSLPHSESEFVWEIPLGLKVLGFWVPSYLQNAKVLDKNAISFVLWWNSLNKTEQNSDFALFPK
jgi:hypothetical protein